MDYISECQVCASLMDWEENGERFQDCPFGLAIYVGWGPEISPKNYPCPFFALSTDVELEAQ